MWVRTRRQAQLEDEEEVVKQEDAGKVVKEDKNANDLDLDRPSMDDIINDRYDKGQGLGVW